MSSCHFLQETSASIVVSVLGVEDGVPEPVLSGYQCLCENPIWVASQKATGRVRPCHMAWRQSIWSLLQRKTYGCHPWGRDQSLRQLLYLAFSIVSMTPALVSDTSFQ